MSALSPSTIMTGPRRHARWGQVLTLDLGVPDRTLAISRENRLPRAAAVVTMAARELMRLSKGGEKVETILVMGSEVDPTRHPEFREITENLRELRNKHFPRAKLTLLSTAPCLDTAGVRVGVGAYDVPIVRLEGGTARTYAKLSGNKQTPLGKVVQQLSSLDRLIIRAQFVRGEVDNSTDSEVRSWIRMLQDVRPSEIQISTPDPRARGSQPRGIPPSRLKQIVEQLVESLGTTVTVLEPADLAV
jgi:hypothetical protein